ncbi:MAG: cyclic pyranopterin monophosphate synthase MoaC [Aigarchaeota archaeon]|nr:cyclic pyranopterin monophosphate synthase MoaC [Aigarchaeota archaeon]
MGIRQVDISDKEAVKREAVAKGFIKLRPDTIKRIRNGEVEKGDPLQIAKMAGINAAKLTPFLLPLCHPLRLEQVIIDASINDDGIEVVARVKATEKTGVEMEALTALSIALLNIWDVVKAYEKDALGQYPETMITDIRIVEKRKWE